MRLRPLLICLALSTALPAAAADRYGAFLGGWAYQAKGSVTSGSQLDFQDDLGLKTQGHRNFAVDYSPGAERSAWLPSASLDFITLGAEGEQQIQPSILFGTLPLGGGTTAASTANLDNLELAAHWSKRWGSVALEPGLSVSRLDGDVVVTNTSSGQQDARRINQTFPQAALGVSWQPFETLRLSAAARYAQYQDDRALGADVSIVWRMLGPVGLEGGWRARRYKVTDGDYLLDARLAGARIGLRFEL